MADTSTDITIEDNNAYLMAMGEGSSIEIHAADAEKESWTQLETTAEAGSNQLIVQESTGWEVGDVIAITSTDESDEDEEFTILAISDDGMTITLDGELENEHRGETVTYDNGLTGDDYMEWETEIRAEVALLSRNVTIQGDEDSVDDGYGGHTMVMDGAEQYISGAEYYRMGQEGIVGSYPIHFHLLEDAEGQYVQNVSVHDSYNKGTTIHGTSNILFQDNVIYNTSGHGLFLEDGSESGNQIIGNLIFGTRASDEDTAAIPTDASDPTSYWMENPDQVMINNVAGGSDQNGFWIFPENTIHGDSAELGIGEMGDMADLIFQDNVAHSNAEFGVSIEGSIDADTLEINRGSTTDAEYATIDGLLAYENDRHGLWAFTNDLIVENSMFVENDFGGMMSKGANYVNDSVFADNSVGLYLYTVGGTEVSDVHFEDNEPDIFVHYSSNLNNGSHALSGITTADDAVLDLNMYDSGDALTNLRTVVDVDGSITGTAGATLTSGDTNYEFATAPDAYYDDDLGLWVSEATIARTRLIVSDDITLNVTRSDGVSVDDYTYTSTYSSFLLKTVSGLDQDIAYLLDMDSTPETFRLTNQYMQAGESVVYEIPNIGSVGTVRNATEVASLTALMEATSTSYIVQDDSLFVRIIAEETDAEDLAVDEMLAEYADTQSVYFADVVAATDVVDDPSFTAELITAIEAQTTSNDLAPEVVEATTTSANDDFELELYESTSDTTVVTDDMARWSTLATWDGDDAPGADSIVVIGEGETVILDQSLTVEGIIVNGGELIIEDGDDLTIDLSTDYLLVMNGGLFQAGTEDDLLDTEFTLTLEGDDPEFDLEVTEILNGNVDNTIFAAEQSDDAADDVSALASSVSTDDDSPTLVYALNAGGDDFTSANGVEYQADDFENGETFSITEDIAGTEDDVLYQSERWNAGGFTYENEVENGTYDVELNFAEIWGGARTSETRVFDVYVEDILVFNDLDITDEAGFRTAYDLIGEVEVTDGSLTITMTGEVENPKISGYSIWETEGELSQEFTVGSLTDDYVLFA